MAGIGNNGVKRGPGKDKLKPYAEALRRAIARAESSQAPHAIDRIAEQHLAQCAAGDMQAIRELADRLDGRPAQESTVTVNHSVQEQTDQEIAARIAELRGTGTSDGDGAPPIDPSKLN